MKAEGRGQRSLRRNTGLARIYGWRQTAGDSGACAEKHVLEGGTDEAEGPGLLRLRRKTRFEGGRAAGRGRGET